LHWCAAEAKTTAKAKALLGSSIKAATPAAQSALHVFLELRKFFGGPLTTSHPS